MQKVIVTANPKGGVGKTTTIINLSASLAIAGKKVLIIDLDPNGTLSGGIRVDDREVAGGVFDLFLGCEYSEVIYKTNLPQLDIIPCDVHSNETEARFFALAKNRALLKRKLDDLSEKDRGVYDFVIIDTPPSLSNLSLAALYAADSVLIPLQCGYFSIKVVDRLIMMIHRIRKSINPKLTIEGIFLNFYEKNTRASRRSEEEAKDLFENLLLKTFIPKNTAINLATFERLPVVLMDASSSGAVAYLSLAQEIIERNKNWNKRFERDHSFRISFATE
jgi:chromosome partitioning protein